MSPRPVASGTISFGLVAIPVKLYAPIDSSKTVRFNQIHKDCGSRIRQQLFCPECEEVVPRDDLVKGYEFSKGQYVLFSDEEMAGLLVKPSHAIEIAECVPLEEVDPIYFERSYYLGPDKGGEKPYRLLSQTLLETSQAAIGQYTARGKKYLVLLRPFENGLIMQQLYYADEIRSFSQVPMEEVDVKHGELELAKQLVEQTSVKSFEPENFIDDIREQLLGLINQKIEGQEISTAPAEAPKAQVIDLMEALKASLEAVEGSQEGRKPPKSAVETPPVKKMVGSSKG